MVYFLLFCFLVAWNFIHRVLIVAKYDKVYSLFLVVIEECHYAYGLEE